MTYILNPKFQIKHIMLETLLIDTQTNLDYSIRYDETTNCVRIHVKHNIEFFEWSNTITNNLTNGSSENIKISLTPKNVYNILNDYINGVLSAEYKVVMPNNLTFRGNSNLVIEIHSTMKYQDDQDIKTISLNPIDIPIEKRLDLKLAKVLEAERKAMLEQVDTTIKLRLSEIETRFETKLEQKNKHIEILNVKIIELENTCNDYNKKVNTRVENLTANVENLTANVEDLTTNVNDLLRRCNRVTSDAEEMFVMTYGLASDMNKFTTKIDTICTEIDTINTKIDTVYTKDESDEKFTSATTFNTYKSNNEETITLADASVKTAYDAVLHLNNANVLLVDRLEELSKKVDGCVKNDMVYTKKESDVMKKESYAMFTSISNKHESDIKDQTERITVLHSLIKTVKQSLAHQTKTSTVFNNQFNDQLNELSTKVNEVYTKQESNDNLVYAVRIAYNKIVTDVVRPIATKHLFKILQWFFANNNYRNAISCREAAEQDRLDILKWLHESGCPWDKTVCTRAARDGHLDILKYLHENGCPWDESACYWASLNNHSEITKYLHENGCPCNKITCRYCNNGIRPIFPFNDYLKKFMENVQVNTNIGTNAST